MGDQTTIVPAGYTMKFAVTIVSPHGYIHSGAFGDVAQTVCDALSALGHDSIVTTETCLPDRRHVILGAHLLPKINALKPDSIIYNLEQVELGSSWFKPELLALFSKYSTWDYSRANVAALKQLGVQAKHVPVGYMPGLSRIVRDGETKNIDVLFYGSVIERRARIIDSLREHGVRVESVFGVYGNKLDKLISRSKIVLNMHYYESKVFEIVRVSYLLANKVFVVSETGSDRDEDYFASGIAFSEYDSLVDTCIDFLARPADRDNIAARGYELMAARDEKNILKEAIAGMVESDRTADRAESDGAGVANMSVGHSGALPAFVAGDVPASVSNILARHLAGLPEYVRSLIAQQTATPRQPGFESIEKSVRPEIRPIKVNVGCGFRPMNGFVNTDVVPNTKAQLICPAWNLDLPDSCAEELRSHDVIEHLFPKDWPPTLNEFWRVIRPGGTIVLSIPDFGEVARGYTEGRYSIDDARTFVMATVPPFNSCDYNVPESYHRTVHSKTSLTADLTERGFVDIATWTETYPWNLFVKARKPRAISALSDVVVSSGDGDGIPVIIPTFNNATYAKRMLAQLKAVGITNIIVVDNASTAPDMLACLSSLDGRVKIVRLEKNLGPHDIFMSEKNFRWLPDVFCVTDPDLQLSQDLPKNFIAELLDATERFEVGKAGFCLDISTPDLMRDEEFLIGGRSYKISEWESQFWKDRVGSTPAGDPIYRADIDTTFAVYNKKYFKKAMPRNAVRIGGRFTCRHLPWYKDSGMAKSEEEFYRETQKFSYYLQRSQGSSSAPNASAPSVSAPSVSVSSRIPRVLHQIWVGPKPRPAGLMATWQAMNPTFKYEIWDDARCAGFGFRNAQKIAEMPEWNGKADLMRYEILDRYGGILVDADSECLRPLDESMLLHDSFACWESETAMPGLIAAGYVGATAGNRLMKLCIEECARRNMKSAKAWVVVGPKLLTDVVNQSRYTGLHVYPSWTFIPEHHTGTKYSGAEPVYARQYWGSSFDSYEELAKVTRAVPAASTIAADVAADPLVSVVIPCYKQAHYLQDALKSVLDQTYTHWECIVVNDGSPDDASAVVTKFAADHPDRAIRLVEKANGGLAEARNTGIREANGDLVLPLDSDDMLARTFLTKAVAVMKADRETNVVYADLQEFGERHERWITEFTVDGLLRENHLPYASLYRKELWQRVGGYDPCLPWGYEDWNFWVACVSFGLKVQRIPELLFGYRIRVDSMLHRMAAFSDEVMAMVRTLHSSLYSVRQIRKDHRAISLMCSETLAIVDQRIVRHPESPMPYFWRGLALESQGKHDEARAYYERVMELDHGNWQAAERIASAGGISPAESKKTEPKRARARIALLTIATNAYTSFAKNLYDSVNKYFLVDHDVDVFLFTNKPAAEIPAYNRADGAYNRADSNRTDSNRTDGSRIQLHVLYQEHKPWPGMTLDRFHIIRQAPFDDYDYLFYTDIDMLFVNTVGDEVLGDLVATIHPGFWSVPSGSLTYENRPKSKAFVAPGEGKRYYAGGFQGGSREGYGAATRAMMEAIDKDRANGITAVWHDESHWNRYLIDHPPTIALSPSYCYPESLALPFQRKLLALDKNHAALRQEPPVAPIVPPVLAISVPAPTSAVSASAVPVPAVVKNPSLNFEIDTAAMSSFVLTKTSPKLGFSPYPLHEQMLMAGALCFFNPDYVFDWGTHVGNSAWMFYTAKQAFGLRCNIHTIDLPPDVAHMENIGAESGSLIRNISSIVKHFGDGVTTALSVAKREGAKSPMFFLDGDHEYETVKREIAAIRLAFPNAPILAHDSFLQQPKSGYNIGPGVAVREAAVEYGDRLVTLEIGTPGMGLLCPRGTEGRSVAMQERPAMQEPATQTAQERAAIQDRSIVVLVFSKNRAMQLDATLRSFARHCDDKVAVKVLYRASTPGHLEQYRTVAEENPWAEMVPEVDFMTQTLDVLRQYSKVLFLVDDNIFVRPFELGLAARALDRNDRAIGVSFRLGTNTTHCYPLDASQLVPVMHKVVGQDRSERQRSERQRFEPLVWFDWPGAENDFGYPLEVSSSLYRSSDILHVLDGAAFSGPNQLESGMAFRSSLLAEKPRMICFRRSVTFCNPINVVQKVFANRAGNSAEHSSEALALRFAGGDRIRVGAYDSLETHGCHQEVELEFERRAGQVGR